MKSKSSVVNLRIHPAHKREIQKEAFRKRMSMSEWIIQAAREKLERDRYK